MNCQFPMFTVLVPRLYSSIYWSLPSWLIGSLISSSMTMLLRRIAPFGAIDETRRTDNRAIRDAELVHRRGVTQPTPGEIHRRRAVVVKFDVIHVRQDRVRQELIDHHVPQRIPRNAIRPAR